MSSHHATASPSAAPVHLLRALRLVIAIDSDPSRQALFAALVDARRLTRVALRLYEVIHGTRLAAALIAGFGLATAATIAGPVHSAKILTVARHANARRQVARLCGWLRPLSCEALRASLSLILRPNTLAALSPLLRRRRRHAALRLLHRIEARHGFLVASRSAVLFSWYARSRRILDHARPEILLVSSDSNPEELGATAAARACGVPQVFIAHAHPTHLSPRLDFTLSILESQAALEARTRKGPVRGRVLLAGVEGESAPMDPERLRRRRPVIGIFTSKALHWPTFARTVQECFDCLGPSRVVVRWHPSMLTRPHLSGTFGARPDLVETSGLEPLADIARQCDWVIADENSNVHLPVLKLGIPTVAVSHLGVYPESRADQYGFVARGVIPAPLHGLRTWAPDAIVDFYSGEWRDRFQRFDAGYLRSTEVIAEDVRQAVSALLNAGPSPAAHLPAEAR